MNGFDGFIINSLHNISANTKVVELSFKYPGIFVLLFFLLTFQIGTLFNASRHIMKFLLTDILQFHQSLLELIFS